MKGLNEYRARKIYKFKNTSFEFLLLIVFLFSMYFDMSDTGVYYSKIIIIFIIFSICIMKRSHIYVKGNISILFLFTIIVSASGLYGVNNETALGNIIALISCLMLMIIISNIISDQHKLDIFINILMILGIILSVRVMFITDYQRLFQGTYYPDVVVQLYIGNRNVVALMIAISLNFCLYNIYIYKKYRRTLLCIVMFIAILLTGSRKGLLVCILPITLFLLTKFLKSKRMAIKLKIFTISILLSIVTFNLVMKVDIIYDAVGFRIESIYREIVYGEKSDEGSYNVRQDMVERGLEYFKEKPIIGHGVSNYRYKYKHDVGKETYSHNNYIELLVNNGIIGFVLYYLFYFSVIINTIKNSKTNIKKDKEYYLFNVCILVTMLVSDVGMVSYNSYITYMILGLSINNFSKENEYKVNYKFIKGE